MCNTTTNIEYTSKTQLYLRVKKPLLERQRRARVNKSLDALKQLVAEFQGDDAILRMDKAEMLEAAIVFMRRQTMASAVRTAPPMDGFRNGYMNAVNEVSRLMAATPGMSVDIGKRVMTHLGGEFNRLLHGGPPQALQQHSKPQPQPQQQVTSATSVNTQLTVATGPSSPASSGYHSDSECELSPRNASTTPTVDSKTVWRPW